MKMEYLKNIPSNPKQKIYEEQNNYDYFGDTTNLMFFLYKHIFYHILLCVKIDFRSLSYLRINYTFETIRVL